MAYPPAPFYTNDVESQNNVIKQQIQYKAKELPEFVAIIQTMIANKKEIIRAIAGLWEYQIVEKYKHLQVEARKFYQITENQKQKHVNSFFSAPLTSCGQEIANDNVQSLPEASADCPQTNVLLQLQLPSYVATKMGSMDRYLQWLLKQKSDANLSVLADVNMPKGAGKSQAHIERHHRNHQLNASR